MTWYTLISSNIRAEKKQSSSSSPVTSLPEEVVVDILARVPICDYPTVSLLSKRFRSLVSSPEVYARRSSLGCTEHCLYVVLCNRDDGVDRLCTLRRKGNGNSSSRLVRIPWVPAMRHGRSFVAMGSKIYAFGGNRINSFTIDLLSHTMQPLPSMPFPMSDIVADVICGRIYVIGILGTNPKSKGMVVFDTETQTWEGPMTVPGTELCDMYKYGCVLVVADKMYMWDIPSCFVYGYDPKESKWETDEMMSSKVWINACVVDDVLYFYKYSDRVLSAYDPEHKCWQVVKGVEDLMAEIRRNGCGWSRTVSYGGKLVLLFAKGELVWLSKEICCAEISLERRRGGQIWGRVDQWCDHALIAGNFFVTKSLDIEL